MILIRPKHPFAIIWGAVLSFCCLLAVNCLSQSADLQPRMQAQYFKDSLLGGVIKHELAFSMAELGKPSEPLPKYILGTKIGGEYTLMSIGETLAALEQLKGTSALNQYPFVDYIKPWILAEAPTAHTFGQLFMIRTLLTYQTKPSPSLADNKLWAKFSSKEKKAIEAALDFRKSYDPIKHEPTNGRPLNYLAVGLLIGAYGKTVGINPDQPSLNYLAEQCADIIIKNNGILDDDKGGRGRYDRYGREFNQFTWEALKLLKREDLLLKIKPAVINSAQIWFDMMSPETGYSYPYGRSLQNSWDDTFEQCGFLATYPELSPVPLPLIATIFSHAWQHYLTNQYNSAKHLNRMLEPGRSTYSYAGADRIWSYTIHTFGKAALSGKQLLDALTKANIPAWTIKPELPPVSRFIPINHKDKTKKMGWWVVRNAGNYLVLPIVGSFKNSATSDYLPIPYGFAGIQIPVQQQLPALIPFLTLPDGITLTTADGADSIYLNPEGNKLTIIWRNLVDIKGQASINNIEIISSWSYQDQEIVNDVKIKSSKDLVVSKLSYWIPTSYTFADLMSGSVGNNKGHQFFVNVETDWVNQITLQAPSHTELGRGAFGPVQMILQWTGTDVPLLKGKTYNLKALLRHSAL